MQQAQDVQNTTSAEASTSSAASNAAHDSGIEAGSSSEYDQDNSGNNLLQAQDDTSEYSTDEG
jgi:hypothetical protein